MSKIRKCSRVWIHGFVCLVMLSGCAATIEDRFAAYTDAEVFAQGKALYDQGEYKQAVDYFVYAKEQFNRSEYAGPARFYAGNSYLALEKYEDAAGEYESFLLFFSKDPLAAEAQFNLGRAYFEQAKGPERDQEMQHKALAEFEALRDTLAADHPYAAKTAEQLRLTRQELARHEYSVGNFYRHERQYEASNRRLGYLVEAFSESELQPDAWYLQGLNYQDLKQPEQAAAAFAQMLALAPDHALAADARTHLETLGEPQTQNPAPAAAQSVPESAIEGFILTVRDMTVTTNLLNAHGIHAGMKLRVYRANTQVGVIQITVLHDGFSTAEILSITPDMQIREDDRVCCPIVE